MTNSEMKAGRYARWHLARRKLAWIAQQTAAGRTVYLTTYTRSTAVKTKHLDMLRATKSGLLLKRGKAWDCIDGCQITAA